MTKYSVKLGSGPPFEFESNLLNHQAVAVLEALSLEGLDEGRRTFARSMVRQYRERGHLSPAQLGWVHFYATGKWKEVWLKSNAGEFDASKLIELFVKAQGRDAAGKPKLQCPQMFIKVAGHELGFRMAGPRSKPANQGCVFITNGDDYWGKIAKDGALTFTRQMTLERQTMIDIGEQIKEFLADPQGFAVKFGRVTGRCCFCGIELTNRHSIFNGYGQVCAEHWSLPYVKAPDDWTPTLEAHGRIACEDLKDGA